MKAISKIYTFLVFTILYIPIIVLVLFSFNSSGNTGAFSGPSLYWYRELFSSHETFTALKNTLVLAVSTAVISTVIGTSAVVGIEKMKNKAVKGSILSVTNIPMMNPEIVTGISIMLLFVFVGIDWYRGKAGISYNFNSTHNLLPSLCYSFGKTKSFKLQQISYRGCNGSWLHTCSGVFQG